jgi:hypothetical protein
MNPHHKTVFVLTLRPIPGNWRATPLLRLRAALKTLLRGYGLRCEHIAVEPPLSAVAETVPKADAPNDR